MQTLSATCKRVMQITVSIDTVKTPQQTPSSVLPFLGWERAVDIWNPDRPDQIKRNVITASIPLHFKKARPTRSTRTSATSAASCSRTVALATADREASRKRRLGAE